MERRFFDVQVFLLFVLLVLIFRSGGPQGFWNPVEAKTGGTELPRLLFGALPPSDLDARGFEALEGTAACRSGGLASLPREARWGPLYLVFDEDRVPEDDLGRPLGGAKLRLEPEVPVRAVWTGKRALALHFPKGLPEDREFLLSVDPDLGRARPLPAPARFRLRTPPLECRGYRLWDSASKGKGKESEGFGLDLEFSMPVEGEALAKALVLRSEKDGRPVSFEVRGDPHTGKKVSRTLRVRLAPGAWPPDSKEACRVELREGLKSAGGSLGLPAPWVERVRFLRELRLVRVAVTSTGIRLRFSHDFPLPETGAFRLEPDLPFLAVRDSWGIELKGDFPPGRVVRLILEQGFPFRGRHRLGRALRRSFLIPDRTPRIEFADVGEILSARARPEVEIRGVNMAEYGLAARRLRERNAVFAAANRLRSAIADQVFGPVRRIRRRVAASRNAVWSDRVDLEELLGARPRGVFELTLTEGTHGRVRARRILQITDLGARFRVLDRAVLVQVSSLADGTPLKGALVRLLGRTNRVLGFGVTGEGGLLEIPYRAARGEGPFLLEVSREGDRAFLDLRNHAARVRGTGLRGRPFLCEGEREAWVYVDQGVVRPGKTVHGCAVVRDLEGRAPYGTEVEVRWIESSGRTRKREVVKLPPSAMLAADLRLLPEDPGGLWRLEIRDLEGRVLGSRTFRVEAFLPDRIAARFLGEPEGRLGGPLAVRVEARWLDGRPADGLRSSLRASLLPLAQGVPGFETYSFRGPGKPERGFLRQVRTRLDPKGRSAFRLALPRGEESVQGARVRLEAEVLAPSGRPLAFGRETLVAAGPGLLGVKVAPRDGGRGLRASLVLVDPKGRPVEGPERVELRLEGRSWSREGDPFRWGSGIRKLRRRVLAQSSFRLAGGRGAVDLEVPDSWRTPPQGTWLAVVARWRFGTVESSLHSTGEGGRRLVLRRIGPAPVPGGEVVLEADCPFPGSLLVTLEDRGFVARRLLEVAAGKNRVSLRVPEGFRGAWLHAVGMLQSRRLREGGPGPFFLAAATGMPVPRPEDRLETRLEAPGRALPGTRVVARITAPGARKARIFLVDEGILQRTLHPSPDPLRLFLGPRRIAGRGAAAAAALRSGQRFPEVVDQGGGKDQNGGALRLRGSISPSIEAIALASSLLDLDERGRGSWTLRLPETEGGYRWMAVAAGPRGVGAAAGPCEVRHPLGVHLETPRRLAPGDRCRLALEIRAPEGASGPVEIRAAGRGGLVLEGKSSLRLSLPSTGRLPLGLEVRAGPREGLQALVLEISLGGRERRVEASFEVRSPSAHQVRRLGLGLRAGRNEAPIPEGWIRERMKCRLVRGASSATRLLPALRALTGYPYGCVEQTSSKGLALLHAGPLLEGLTGGEGGAPHEDLVRLAIDRIFAMQLRNGGLSTWIGGEWMDPFGSIYALSFLLEAEERGFELPGPEREALVGAVQGSLARLRSPDLQAMAVAVLARAGRPMGGWLELLKDEELGPEGRARLALALARVGRDGEARAFLEGLGAADCASVPRRGTGSLASPLRAKALLALARLALGERDGELATLIRDLEEALCEPDRLTTQEQAVLLSALAAWDRVNGREEAEGVLLLRGEKGSMKIPPRVEVEVAPPAEGPLVFEATAPCWVLLEFEGLRRLSAKDRKAGAELAELRPRLLPERGDRGKEAGRETPCKSGERYRYELTVRIRRRVPDPCLSLFLPGGLEPDSGPLRFETLDSLAGRRKKIEARIAVRDDRVLCFPGTLAPGRYRLSVPVRATMPGTYARPAPLLEAMYDPGSRARGPDLPPLVVED